MLVRLCGLIFLSFIVPAMASVPSAPQQQLPSRPIKTVFYLAQKEMPLPVIQVVSWPLGEGKRKFVIEMSTAGLAWAKKPFCHVAFVTHEEDGGDLEQALHEASAFAKTFIEAAKGNPTLQTARWY